MIIEKEKKFLLKYLPIYQSKINIQQGYLMFDKGENFRIRIIDNTIAFITYKSLISVGINKEFEYQVPLTDGIELLKLSKISVKKTRYIYSKNIVIDLYIIDGKEIGVVEVEYENEDELNNLPNFIGNDITGDKYYSNINIAKIQSL